MTEFKRGLKAGIVSGIIWGVIASTIGVLQAKIFLTEMSGFGYEMTLMAEQVFWQFVVMTYLLFIIIGIICGIIVGLIYAAVYNSLPSSKSIIKGIVLSLIFWLIFVVGIGFFLTMIGSGVGIDGIESSYIESVAINLIECVIFGILLGLFWDKFGVNEEIPKEIPKTTIIKTIKCPSCGETTQIQGSIGARVAVICPKCSTKGFFQFR